MPDTPLHPDNIVDDPRLASVPTGAFALAGTAVGLLLLAWLVVYFFVFLQRGPVG
ncbi:MAG: hypothetical protein K2P94_03545 [Rhodospirillaceae bacterium]|nr:hypothetical protein [Rhodospirillaceae bacterium]